MSYEIRQVPWLYEGQGGATYYKGQNTPEAIVLHKMQGWATTAIGWAVSGAYGKSWHFSIRLDGVIYQHLSYADGGYHAGISDNQGRTYPPTWPLWKGVGRNVNTYTIGIELEGFSGNAIPTAQREALKWLLGKICDETGIRYDRDHLPPHADIDTVNRVNDFDYPEGREDLYLYLLEDDGMDEAATRKMVAEMVFGSQARYDELTALGVVPLESRVVQMETGGDTVARADFADHVANHGGGATPPVQTITISGVGLTVEEED